MFIRKLVEGAWIFFIAVCLFEIIVNLWRGDTTKALIFSGFAVLGAIMFSIRRKQRKRFEKEEN